MFSIFKKKPLATPLVVDIHSHLIPAIDDGSKSMENSIELILALKELGYKKLITTPHTSDMFPNTTEIILNGYEALIKELKKREIDIEIEVASEYYADEHFEKLLDTGDILTFGDKNYLLFELSYFTPPHDLEDLVYEIKRRGYTPILAHPERYLYLHDSLNKYRDIKDMGVLFQVNINSTSGFYNKGIQKVSEQLIQNSMVDFLGSDTHHMTHIKNLKKSLKQTLYKKIFKKNNILNNSLL
ncbi:MAG TPA: capsular biosynthesis protein [Campylobacterales bacterium]|nr:capsular biosynthesis protein [Campylobacterales bacterium]HHD80241.1 capsular biosynthesis protein [Campylobacterales bacterium]